LNVAKSARKQAAQVELARKAAALKAANEDKQRGPVATPQAIAEQNAEALVAAKSYSERNSIRLIFKPELLRLIGVSYGSIFSWMRAGKFPLAREIGPGGRATKIAWLEHEIMEWLAARPQRRMKPPAAPNLTTKP
jgi:predicted DNA-binding transcriptional regulator AlpA